MNATAKQFGETVRGMVRRELVGQVRGVRFWDADSYAIVAQLAGGETVVGETDGEPLAIGTAYRFFGKVTHHARHGEQFAFDTYVVDTPHERKGVVAYLAKEAGHVGQAIAARLWDAYGPQAIEVLRTDPQRVARDGHLGWVEASEAADDLRKIEAFERTRVDLFNLFAGRGFPRSTVSNCITTWGVLAAERVKRDPFTMLVRDIPGAGWKRCDRLYLDLQRNPSRLKRQMLAGWASLRDGIDGNTWHPYGAFNAAVVGAVGAHEARFDRAADLGVRAEWLRKHVDGDGKFWIAEESKAANERDLANKVRALQAASRTPWPLVSYPAVSVHQSNAIAPHAHAAVLILAGTPGTGKTFTAAAILRELVHDIGSTAIAVCAPTGKAAVRITEAMGRYRLPLKATTIHSLLGIGRNGHDGKGWGFTHNEENPLPFRVVVVDETSMLDADLAADLFRAVSPGSRVLLVGDPYQLPPVGHGAPLRDLVAAGVPCATLTEIQRNAGAIVQACAAIKDGKRFVTCDRIDEAAGANLRLIECQDTGSQLDALTKVIAAVRASGRRDPVWDTQVITPLNEKSPVSRVPLNARLQGLLNPAGENDAANRVGDFRVGDKVICLRNCRLNAVTLVEGVTERDVGAYRNALDSNWQTIQHYLANGDLGRVDAVDAKTKTIVATFVCPARTVKIPLGKRGGDDDQAGGGAASDFGLAYAITVHKSQGSEWPLVIVMVDEAAGPVACRELIYTAVSRARDACVLIGKRAVVDRQVVRVSLGKRKTFLRELLCKDSR